MSAWFSVLVSMLGGGILLGLGVSKVRSISAPASYLFAAAGLLIPLSSCCTMGLYTAAEDSFGPMMMMNVTTLLGSAADLTATLLIVAAFVVLSRARTASGAAT